MGRSNNIDTCVTGAAELRANELQRRFAGVSREAFPVRRRWRSGLVWFVVLFLLGLFSAAYTDMNARQRLAAKDRSPFFRYCSQAEAAGVTPILHSQAGYAWWLDADRDGIACEWN